MRMTAGVFALGIMSLSGAWGHHKNPLVGMAHRAQDHTEDLRYEVKRHFRASGGYRYLMEDLGAIDDGLGHVEKLADHLCHDSLRQIRRHLVEVDRRVRQLSDVLDGIERGRYGRRIDCDTRKVKELLSCLGKSVHEMEDFVDGELRRYGHGSGRGHEYRDRGVRGSSLSWSWQSGSGREVRGPDVLRELLLRLGSR